MSSTSKEVFLLTVTLILQEPIINWFESISEKGRREAIPEKFIENSVLEFSQEAFIEFLLTTAYQHGKEIHEIHQALEKRLSESGFDVSSVTHPLSGAKEKTINFSVPMESNIAKWLETIDQKALVEMLLTVCYKAGLSTIEAYRHAFSQKRKGE